MMAAGIRVFSTLEEAKAAGFEPYERTAEGYLVRRTDGRSFALAIVKLEKNAEKEESR